MTSELFTIDGARVMPDESPYLKPYRLQDIISALQFLGSYKDYKLPEEDWKDMMKTSPRSGGDSWGTVFDEHPEFFRKSNSGVALVWRRTLRHADDDRRPPLEPKDIGMLIDTAIRLRLAAVEEKRDKRWWLPIIVAFVAFFGAVLGSWIRA